MNNSKVVIAAAGDLVLGPQLGKVLNLIMAISFLAGVVLIISGSLAIRRGETEGGKHALIAGALLAGAPMIMKVLFEIFGLGEVVPNF